MKLSRMILVASLIALGATEALLNLANFSTESLGYRNLTLGARASDDFDPTDETLWHQCKCRGAKLLLAMTQNPPEASRFLSPLASPWDGEMKQELAEWGYKENTGDPDIDFDLRPVAPFLASLRVSPINSLHGGPNYCFSYTHCNSNIVERDENGNLPPLRSQHYTKDGRRYRVTAAHGSIVINPRTGYILFLRRGSPQAEARELWDVRDSDPVPLDELPALRASSDLAWAFWNRVQDSDKLHKIEFFVSMSVINSETERVIDMIIEKRGLDEVPTFAGIHVTPESEDYLALIGTPNAIGVGYFLAQHKAQLKGNCYITGIRVYRASQESTLSNIIFVVGPAPFPPPPAPTDPIDVLVPPPGADMEALANMEGDKVIERSKDEKNIVRSHRVWINP